MSNVETLLEFGDSEAPHEDTNQTNTVLLSDPFDPLSPSTGSSGSAKSPDQTNLLDSFDPFAGPADTMSADTGPTTNGEAMSNDQIKTMEQQFDDLLGGFSPETKETENEAPTGDLLGDFEDDTEVVITKRAETDEDGTTTVVTETRTEQTEDDEGAIIEIQTTNTEEVIDDQVEEEPAEEPMEEPTEEPMEEPTEPTVEVHEEITEDNVVNGTEASESGSEQGDRMSTASDKASEPELFLTNTSEGSRLEDQLSDYQPPKQYVKKEEKESRASPTVYITDSRSRESTPSGASDTSAEYSVKPSKPFGALRASWGTPPPGDSDSQCKACGKRVYAMEKMLANKAVYHKTCFRCCECKSVLRVGNFAAMEGQVYCKPHFMSLFKTKGNYDEGFGRQRHSALWTNKEGTPGKEDAQEEYYEDNDDQTRDYEDDVDAGNGEVVHGSLDKEEIHFSEMNSVRSKFESASHTPEEPGLTPKSARPVSKWDKPKTSPPAPINAHSDDEILSPEEGEGYGSARRFTPPRDELEGQVREVFESEPIHDPNVVRHDDQGFKEEELPPPSMAKTIAAKFRSMEDVSQSPGTPETKISKKQTQKSYSVPKKTAPAHQPAPEPVTYNGTEEQEEAKPEEELPERGFTRSLVAQWRSREQLDSPVDTATPKSNKSKKQNSTKKTGSARSKSPVITKHTSSTTAHTPPLANGDHVDGHLTRDAEQTDETPNTEDELPPPAMARNLRAKFENMAIENEQDVEVMTPRTLRKFKFAVKETGFHVKTPNKDDPLESEYAEPPPESDDDDEPFYEDINEVQETENEHLEENTNIKEEELPPTAFTRSMLAKFRSMEDVNKPPPTPEYAEKQVKTVTTGVHRMTNPNVRSLSVSSPEHDSHEMEREQPDGAYQQEAVNHEEEYDYNNYDDFNAEGGEFENEPDYNPNVIRESDKLDGDELPELGTTRSLLAKFQTLQAH